MSAAVENKRFLAKRDIRPGHTTTFKATILRESAKAILVRQSVEIAGFEIKREAWIPKSQIIAQSPARAGQSELTIPDWLANEKGLCS